MEQEEEKRSKIIQIEKMKEARKEETIHATIFGAMALAFAVLGLISLVAIRKSTSTENTIIASVCALGSGGALGSIIKPILETLKRKTKLDKAIDKLEINLGIKEEEKSL